MTSQNDQLSPFGSTVPGQWLLHLPYAPSSVTTRRYTSQSRIPVPPAETSADAARRAAFEALIVNGGEDGLEKAWRTINGAGANDSEAGVRDALSSPCAIIVANKDGRELWMFEIRGPNGSSRDQYHNEVLDGLQALEEPETFHISDLVSCDSHGHSISCLHTEPSAFACNATWKPGKLAQAWRLFTLAVVEKLAWRSGRRVCMGARPKDSSLISLRPFSAQHLILTINTPRINTPKSPSNNILLLPTRSSATHLGTFDPTPTQSDHLDRQFRQLLGPSWRSLHRGSSVLRPDTPVTWAVYWVSNPSQVGGGGPPMEPKDKDGRGMLVVWPSCLVLSGTSTPPAPSIPSRKRAIAATTELAAPEELMGIASSLFDFLSTYNEPPPPETVPEAALSTAGDLPTPQTGPHESEASPKVPFEAETQAEAIEEDDNLFSSNSSSPVPPPDDAYLLGSEQADELAPGTADDVDDLFGDSGEESAAPPKPVELDRDFEMGSPEPARAEPEEAYELYEAADEITADDFAFLDSPAQQGEGDEGNARAETEVMGEAVQPVLQDATLQVSKDTSSANPIAAEPESSPIAAPDSIEQVVLPPTVETIDTASDHSADMTNTKPRTTLPSSASSDLIPSPFSPLDIARPTSIPSPVFTFPTPAPTPESQVLREDLVERLRQAKRQKGDGDYTSAWHIEEEPSEPEEEFDDSGAPPTPMSEDLSEEADTDVTGSQKGGDGRGEVNGGLLEWRGARCVGAELVWIKDDGRAWEALGRPWNEDWAAGTTIGASALLSPPASPIDRPHLLEHVDLDRLAAEIVANRYFRQALSTKSLPAAGDDELGLLTTTGTPISDILIPTSTSDEDSISRTLGSCNVHAGFAGNVMRLSVAGIRYWRQLGLSPVGGEKEVVGLVMTETPGLRAAARSFLAGMEEVWTQHRLGVHTTAVDAVVPFSKDRIPIVMGELARTGQSDKNSVIYFLLEDGAEIPPILAIPQHALPETILIHVLYASSILPRQLPDIALDVYNRIQGRLHPIASAAPQAPTYLQYPSFTLAPDETPKPALTLQWPLRSYDILNRWRYVHAAYTSDESGVAVVFVIDAEGENYDIKVVKTRGRKVQDWLRSVWEFCVDFAARAAIEWRMSMTRVGRMGNGEVEGWKELLRGQHVTLVVVDPATTTASISQISAPPPVPAPILADPSARIADDTLAASTLTYPHRLPLSLAAADDDTPTIYPLLSFALSVAGSTSSPSGMSTATYHVLSHRPALGKEDEKVDEVLSREFQKLVYLGRLRFGFEGGAVGVHVAAVQAVGDILERLGRGEGKGEA